MVTSYSCIYSRYMLPLFLVYYSEYFINQGACPFPCILFPPCAHPLPSIRSGGAPLLLIPWRCAERQIHVQMDAGELHLWMLAEVLGRTEHT
jgi:hypothetical protein